jgi:ribosomal protein L33
MMLQRQLDEAQEKVTDATNEKGEINYNAKKNIRNKVLRIEIWQKTKKLREAFPKHTGWVSQVKG